MPNLETLTIEINANSQQASEGVGRLIGSLRNLAKAVGTVVPALRGLNASLRELKQYGGLKLPTFGNNNSKAQKNIKKTTDAIVEQNKAVAESKKEMIPAGKPYELSDAEKAAAAAHSAEMEKRHAAIRAKMQNYHYSPAAFFGQNMRGEPMNQTKNEMLYHLKSMTKYIQENGFEETAKRYGITTDQLGGRLLQLQELLGMTSSKAKDMSGAVDGVKESTENASKGTKKLTDGIKETGEDTDGAAKKASKFAKELLKIENMMKSMILRTAMRSVIKGFQEAWQSIYKFSKAMGGEFAANVERARGLLKGTAINILSAFAPAMNILVPVLNVVASAIKYLCDMLQNLFQLLGLGSEMFGTSVDAIAAYGNQSNKTAKQVLASFDELNVISNDNNNNNNNTTSTNGLFTNEISEELAKLQVIIGEASIAIGLILAFSGHIGLGVGLIAIGAAAIVKTVVNDWGKLTQDTKDQIAEIMAIAGLSALAIGLILAFTGNIGLGVAMVALGAANLVAVATLNDTLSPEMQQKIATISAIVGAAMLAIGAILCFTGAGIPLGLALMAAGGIALVTAIVPNWDTLKQKIMEVMGKVRDFLVQKWEEIKTAVNNAWEAVKKWFDDNIITPIRNAWNAVIDFFVNLWNTVSTAVSDAWNAVTTWIDTNIVQNVKKAWDAVSGFFSNLWGSVTGAVTGAWDAAKNWWENSGISEKVKGAWDGVSGFFEGLFGLEKGSITKSLKGAWDSAKNWWTTNVSDKVKEEGIWGGVKGFFEGVFGDNGIGGFAKNAWTKVSDWWTTNVTANVQQEGVWGGVKGFFKGLFGEDDNSGIRGFMHKAWDLAKNWWDNTALGQKVNAIWEPIGSKLGEVWGNIKTGVSEAYSKVKDWVKTKWSNFKSGWEGIKSNLTTTWDNVKSSVSGAWDKVSSWIGTKWSDLSKGWEDIKTNLTTAWDNVKTSVSNAWSKFTEWKNAKWSQIQGAWKSIKEGLTGAWDNVKVAVSNAWGKFVEWKNTTWGQISGAWDKIKKGLVGAWDSVKTSVSDAWGKVTTFAGTTWDKFKSGWEDVKKNLKGAWDTVSNSVSGAWDNVKTWAGTTWEKVKGGWADVKKNLSDVWDNVKGAATGAWDNVKTWWETNVKSKIEDNKAWGKVKDFFSGAFGDKGIKGFFEKAFTSAKSFWGENFKTTIENKWKGVASWFEENVTGPIAKAWEDLKTSIKGILNALIKGLNGLGKLTIPKLEIQLPVWLGGQKLTIMNQKEITLWSIPEIKAKGDYNIQKGQLFIANEAGPEMVGTMDGHTAVANQEQIIEGIRRGVSDGQMEQNNLLREQNRLLTAILQKEGSVKIGASSAFGRVARQSLDMYDSMVGV